MLIFSGFLRNDEKRRRRFGRCSDVISPQDVCLCCDFWARRLLDSYGSPEDPNLPHWSWTLADLLDPRGLWAAAARPRGADIRTRDFSSFIYTRGAGR